MKFVCIHGHFYQPPRENPWLEAVEVQDSAYPYHDWNERITAECYAANAASRTLDTAGRIARITNNYAHISCNFGPTLMAWLERAATDVHQAIVAADRESRARFSGHGSALAQAYNHMIMPLAPRRDKVTQVGWGVRDFVHRFGREPEGMWLPETAVDLETLEVLAEHRIRFTILAPNQAARVRERGARAWRDVTGSRIDTTMPYAVRLPSGREIAVFFYDGPTARAVAFERLLSSGEALADRVLSILDGEHAGNLAHIATDGETYGHHHRFGDMALAYALHHIESRGLARLTNYGEYLERFPPTHEVEIVTQSSWSCAHGVERWRADCGCATGGNPGWRQAWRGPLRAALDWLRDALAERFTEHAAALLADPWAARDGYIEVVLDRSDARVDDFLSRHAVRPLAAEEQVRALALLEMQRQIMLAYTSCGWFFDDVAGIESAQILAFAGRAIQIARDLLGDDTLETRFTAMLERAVSNDPEEGSARTVYERRVRPAMVDLPRVAAHVAISSMFEESAEVGRAYCYRVERRERRRLEAGRLRLTLGRLTVASELTRRRADLAYAVLHFGDHNLSAGVAPLGQAELRALTAATGDAFGRADMAQVVRLLDRELGGLPYSLASLFRDDQRRILDLILASTFAEAEAEYAELFDHHVPLMRFLAHLSVPMPAAFQTAAELVLNARLKRLFEAGPPDPERAQSLLQQALEYRVTLDGAGLAFALRRSLERAIEALGSESASLDHLRHLVAAVELVRTLPFEVDLWRLQNRYWELRERRASGSEEWEASFRALGELLNVRPR